MEYFLLVLEVAADKLLDTRTTQVKMLEEVAQAYLQVMVHQE